MNQPVQFRRTLLRLVVAIGLLGSLTTCKSQEETPLQGRDDDFVTFKVNGKEQSFWPPSIVYYTDITSTTERVRFSGVTSLLAFPAYSLEISLANGSVGTHTSRDSEVLFDMDVYRSLTDRLPLSAPSSGTATIVLTRVDKEKTGRAEGTFEMEYTYPNTGAVYRVTEGKFSVTMNDY